MRPLLALLLAALLLAPGALAQYPDPQRAPRYHDSRCAQEFDKRFVFDYLGLLPGELAGEVEGAACEVHASTSAHFALVLVNSTSNEALESYALHLFERWGLGDRQRNDGLLLLYVREGSAVRVEVGYGLEGVVNARVAQESINVMADAKARSLEAGDPEDEAVALALTFGSAYLLTKLADGYTEAGFPPPRPSGPPWWFWLLVALVVLGMVLALARSSGAGGRRSGWGYGHSPYWSTGRGSSWSGGSDWSGGGSFGGGRSGGGGGSGRI